MKAICWTISFILFASGCSQKNPIAGKWNLVSDDWEGSKQACERIVITDDLFVCDGRRTEIHFRVDGDNVVLVPKELLDVALHFKVISGDEIILNTQNDRSFSYVRVLP